MSNNNRTGTRKKGLQRLPLGDLVLDFSLSPRSTLDVIHTSQLIRALDAQGVEVFPPVVVDAASLRVVDGMHRVTAYRRRLTPDTPIPCDVRQYASEADVWLDAVRANARHGRALSPWERANAFRRALELGVSRETVADAIAVRVDYLDTIAQRRFAVDAAGDTVVLKRSMRRYVGQRMSAVQVDVNRRHLGIAASDLASALLDLYAAEAFDLTDPLLVQSLLRLHEALAALEPQLRAAQQSAIVS